MSHQKKKHGRQKPSDKSVFAKKPKEVVRQEEVIKKSTFIALIAPAETPAGAMDFIHKNSDPAATHNCWAYHIGQNYRFNDDGEPGGTAGKPILAAITGQGFDHTVALVIRYFGGIKLGTGGLMRAYGGVVARGLQATSFEYLVPEATLTIQVPFEYIQAIHNVAKKHGGTLLNETYGEHGAIIHLRVPQSNRQQLLLEAGNMTRGQVQLTSVQR